MKASVYCTRDRGAKLPRPTAPVSGELLVLEESKGDARWLRARLVDERGHDLLRPMIKAQVGPVTANGIVIKGTEVVARTSGSKSNAQLFPQVWWVLVHTSAALEQFAGVDALDTVAERRLSVSSSLGF